MRPASDPTTERAAADGSPKLVAACTYPLTGVGCVTRVYTDHAVFDVADGRFAVREAFGDNTVASLAELTGLELAGPAVAASRSPEGT